MDDQEPAHKDPRVSEEDPPRARAPYAEPVLTVYGDAVELTQARRRRGRVDGGGRRRMRTR